MLKSSIWCRVFLVTLCAVIITAWGLGAASAQGSVQFWLKIEGVEGESTTKGREREIDVLAWSWGGSQSGTTHMGAGGGSGKARIQDLNLTKWVDKSSASLLQANFTGRIFPTIWLDIEVGNRIERFALRNALVSSYSTGGSGGEDRLIENVSINFAKVEKGYLLKDENKNRLFARTATFDAQTIVAGGYDHLPVRKDVDGDNIDDDLEDNDRDNNGIADSLESLPAAPSPARAGIQGIAWLDHDGDGRQVRALEETAAIGTRVEIYRDGEDTPFKVQTVNEETGRYAFLDLDPGTYRLRFVAKPGFQFAPQAASSHADPATGFSDPTAVPGGELLDRNAAILAEESAYTYFTYDDFSDPGNSLILSGVSAFGLDPARDYTDLQLTPGIPGVTASAFTAEPVAVKTFSTYFQFRMRPSFGTPGEGFAFVVNGFTGSPGEGAPLLGNGNGELGYGGIPDSFAVEFDPFSNGGSDAEGVHVGINVSGMVSDEDHPTASAAALGNFADGDSWSVWIDLYENNVLEVRMSNNFEWSEEPLLSYEFPFFDSLNSPRARVGFTAATSGAFQAQEILLWDYESGIDNSLVATEETTQEDLDDVAKAPGALVFEETSRSEISMSQLTTVVDDLVIQNNSELKVVSMPNLVEVFGDLTIEGNPALETLDLPELRTVSGKLSIDTTSTMTMNLPQTFSDRLNIAGIGMVSVNARTGMGGTEVQLGNDQFRMGIKIPEGAFTVPEQFQVRQLESDELEDFSAGAIDSEGSPVNVEPLLGFDYDFEGGGFNLNKVVELRFEFILDAFTPAIRSKVIEAFDRLELTMVGARPGVGVIEAFKLCNTLDFAVGDNCVQIRALDGSDGNVVASSQAKVIEFAFFAKHFSFYGPAIITPIEFPDGGLQNAADRVGSTLGVAVTNELSGPTTHTLTWTSFPVELTSDGQHIHPGSMIQTSSDLQSWTEIGSPQALRLLESAQEARTTTLTGIEGDQAYYRIVLTAP